MNKKNVYVIVVIVGVITFLLGMNYGKSQANSVNLSSSQNRGQFAGMNRGGRGGTGGFTVGSIIAKDDKSLTLQLINGGSKIIFFDTSTKVSKYVDGSRSDLAVGAEVSGTGTANSDGSENAQSIQIRPVPTPTPPATPVVQ